MNCRRQKHELQVAREPASLFLRPHFTGACVSQKIQSGFARLCTLLAITRDLVK